MILDRDLHVRTLLSFFVLRHRAGLDFFATVPWLWLALYVLLTRDWLGSSRVLRPLPSPEKQCQSGVVFCQQCQERRLTLRRARACAVAG